MDFFQKLLMNHIFMSSVTGWAVAQIIKTIINFAFTKSFNAERLVGSGGMPSSHSATVCALSTSTVILYGPDSFEFAISAVLSIIVMYDAIGVRREAGVQAALLNKIVDVFADFDGFPTTESKLKELVGHTPIQVLAGAILGVVVALFIC